MRSTALLPLLLVLAAPVGSDAVLYRCTAANGEVLFTDRPCVDAAAEQRLPPPAAQRAGSLVLDEDTRETLEAMTRANAERRATRARHRAALGRSAARREAERSKRCAAVSARLRAIRSIRRRGYRARDARSLDDEVRALRAKARADC